MSKALTSFDIGMRDVDELVDTYNQLNQGVEKAPEVLKRAALIMAMTAWETYVEDRVQEFVDDNMKMLKGSQISKYVQDKLDQEIRYFHTPNSHKTGKIFEGLVGKNITEEWVLNNFSNEDTKKTLDYYIKLRGEVVHRSVTDKSSPHLVKKEILEKCIKFLRGLAVCTDEILE